MLFLWFVIFFFPFAFLFLLACLGRLSIDRSVGLCGGGGGDIWVCTKDEDEDEGEVDVFFLAKV